MRAGRHIMRRGHWPIIPHLTHYYDEWHYGLYDERVAPETYMQWDFVILRRCDALLFVKESPGADRELALARELGLPVWMSVDEIPKRQ